MRDAPIGRLTFLNRILALRCWGGRIHRGNYAQSFIPVLRTHVRVRPVHRPEGWWRLALRPRYKHPLHRTSLPRASTYPYHSRCTFLYNCTHLIKTYQNTRSQAAVRPGHRWARGMRKSEICTPPLEDDVPGCGMRADCRTLIRLTSSLSMWDSPLPNLSPTR